MYAYCLYCHSQRCRKIAVLLGRQGADRAFSPKIVQNHWQDGKVEREVFDMLPGYVFLYTREPITSFTWIKSIDGVFRILGRKERLYQLENSDYNFAMNILDGNGVIDTVGMVKEGDIVRINSPMFSGMNAKVLRIDYRKQRAQISYQFDKQEWKTWVSCEVIFLSDKSSQPHSSQREQRKSIPGSSQHSTMKYDDNRSTLST